MRLSPELFTSQHKSLYVARRKNQLTHLLNPYRDRDGKKHLMQYETRRAVKTPFWSAYTYKEQTVSELPPVKEVELIRARAAFAMWQDLKDLGHEEDANIIFEQQTGKRPVPLKSGRF